MNTAGIDVSAKELIVVIRKKGKSGKSRVITNDAKGHKLLLGILVKAKIERVCLEATGVYHIDLAVVLHDSEKLELMVVNPKAASNYAKAIMSRTKTDSVDAAILAEYAEQMPFTPWLRPDDDCLTIRAYARRLTALSKLRAQAKNQLHALQATDTTPSLIIDDVQLTIDQLTSQINQLKKHTLLFIGNNQELNETLNLLLSIKGVGETSSIQLMGELLVLPTDMNHRQWVAMAGLDPKHHQSGSSINKRARISKVGNKYLRMALFMPALSASHHDIYVKGFYLHLIENRGLKKMQAICAVMRKMLHAIHGMLRNKEVFDNTRFYKLELSHS